MADFFTDSVQTVERPRPKVAGKFWRTDEPVIGENNSIITGGMLAHQREWWGLRNFIKVLVGGYGAGKTNIISKRAIASAIENAPCPVAVISPTFPIARQTVIKTISEMLIGKRSLYGSGFWWRYNQSTHEFRIRFRGRNGSIIIYSGDRPLSLRGPNLAAAYIDEPFIQDQDVFDQMIARVRHPHATHLEICATGTPESLNWGYDLCEGELKLKHDVGFVRASTRGNYILGDQYVKRLMGAFSNKAANAYIDGYFENLAEGMVYYAFDRRVNVARLNPPIGAEIGVGMDFNVNPMSAVVFWRLQNHIHYFKEYELPNADTEFMCQTLRDDFGDDLETVYPDASGSYRHTAAPGGKSDFYYIKQAGLEIRAPAANPKRRDRYNAVNGKFKSRDGQITLTVDERCPKLIKYFSVYSYELLNKQEQYSHLLDAATYPISTLYPISKDTLGKHAITGF